VNRHDVIIVGAGPGGATAALSLAQRGVRDVLLLDRDRFPRDKTCGSGISPLAIRLADELGYASPTAPTTGGRATLGPSDPSPR
jgi:flavin-dependent dehydrogenase